MKKVKFSDVNKGQEFIYISPHGHWVKDSWTIKGSVEDCYYIPSYRWVWVK